MTMTMMVPVVAVMNWWQAQRALDHDDAERGDVIQTVIIAAAVAAMAIAALAVIRALVDTKVAGIRL